MKLKKIFPLIFCTGLAVCSCSKTIIKTDNPVVSKEINNFKKFIPDSTTLTKDLFEKNLPKQDGTLVARSKQIYLH